MEETNWKDKARERVRPVVLTLDRWGFSPTAVTVAGTVIALAGGWLVAEGNLFWGTLVFLLGSAFDMLDGALARLQGTVSARGAFLDSCLDRFGEAGYLIGVAIYWMNSGYDNWERAVILVMISLFGSMATSYVRARAEGVGETCTVGIWQRTERVIVLGAGGLITHHTLMGALWLTAVLTLVTTFQRIIHVAGKLPGPEPRSPVDRRLDPAPDKVEPETAPEPMADVEIDVEVAVEPDPEPVMPPRQGPPDYPVDPDDATEIVDPDRTDPRPEDRP